MSHSFEINKGEYENSNDSNVIQLGFNISVAGKSTSDFEIYVNDKKQTCGKLSSPHLKQISFPSDQGIHEVGPNYELGTDEFAGGPQHDKNQLTDDVSLDLTHFKKNERTHLSPEREDKMSRSYDLTIADEIKSAMGNFEKFSEHVREIPRLTTRRIYSSTPCPDKKNSRSEGNLSLYGNTARSFVPKHDFRDRKYFRKPKALSSDLFLKPLPAEDYFKKAFVRRYYDMDSYHHYSSIDSLSQYFECVGENKAFGKITAKSDNDKSDSASDTFAPETKTPKKAEGPETNDKQSTSSESAKDIKIYQSGGIIIMQNFNENTDLIEKKDFVGGAKLIEQCSKLAERVENTLHSSDESQRLLLNSSSDEVKGHAGKSVQFDLASSENTKSKSCDSSSELTKNDINHTSNNELYLAKSDLPKTKDNPHSFPQNQDFTSLSTQENDSLLSNLPAMSPTSSTSGKKLEWDSGADVGYLNLDLTKENISTIERIILKGLSHDGVSNKQVVYQKTGEDSATRPSKFVLERMPSELEIEGINQNGNLMKGNGHSNETGSGSKPSTSNTESNQSDNGVVLALKKRQNVKIEDKSRTSSEDKNNRSKHPSKSLKSVENFKFRKTSTTEKLPEKSVEPVEILSCAAIASLEEKCIEVKNVESFEEIQNFSDKSTYVNTLFSDICFDLPLDSISISGESGRSDSSEKCKLYRGESARTKKYKKKRNNTQENNLTGRLKEKINKIIDIARESKKPCARNKFSHKFELKPEEYPSQYMKVDEPKIIKSDPPSLSSLRKSTNPDLREKLVRSRPISASSTSVRSGKPNADPTDPTPKENPGVPSNQKTFADQIIQTAELLYESKSIQAFQSAKCSTTSSVADEITERNVHEISRNVSGVGESKDLDYANVLSCSKSIQAPGMNSSLPKHLAHPKKMYVAEEVNTKSTQFFGGPVSSLPNYHSNATKEAEKVRISKSKLSSEESSRIKLENMKNASLRKTVEREVMRESALNRESRPMAEDICDYKQKKFDKKTRKNKNDPENKENLSVNDEVLTDHSKKSEELSQKESKDSYSLVNESKKSDSVLFGSCDVQLSDDGRNIFLTSDLLKEHGNSIDRNVIQEKYFQSQLLELGRRPMISRSTSMEKKREFETDTQRNFSFKASVSVSCQCSPDAFSKSDELIQYPEIETKSKGQETQPKDAWGADECVPKFNKKRENKYQILGSSVEDKDFALADSLSSSSQTAHSWVSGVQHMRESQNFAVGRTLSFEYLPGHIYENAENLNEKSFKTTKQGMLVVNTVESESDSVPELNAQVKESESGHTLVLENTDTSSPGSDKMKNLDNNLTQLDMVINRLHEKEALFQRITDSVLHSVSKTNGSGDSTQPSGGESLFCNNSQAAEQITCEIEIAEESSKSNGSKPDVNLKSVDTKEISTACQTDAIESNPDQFFEEKKKLEQKMNDEKEQQIKWIENEIHHLNMLRSLLEKQEDLKNSVQRKRRHYYLTETNEGFLGEKRSDQEIIRNILRDSLPKTGSSVRDSTVEDELKLITAPLKQTEDSTESVNKLFDNPKNYAQFGMALSLTRANNVQEITMLPVGVQVTLRNKKTGEKRGSSLEKKSDFIDVEDKSSQNPTVASLEFVRQNDIGVQHPDLNNRLSGSSLSIGSSDSKRCRCFKCNKSKCVCLKSDSTDKKKSSQGRLQPDKRFEEDSTKLVGASSTITSGEFSKSDVKIPEIRDMDNSRGVSTVSTSTPQVSRSRVSSKQERYCNTSEGSVPFDNCVCLCHAEPLPRCRSCNLLNTCKKCQCYKRIRCCVCKITASRGSLQRACATVSSTCLCNNDFCQLCQCSRIKNQICSLCPCHVKLSLETVCKCAKKYEERSCQTDGKECKCCKCNEKPKEELGCYRETKYMAEEEHATESRKPSEVISPSEQKYETEARKPMEEKFSFQMKVPLEKKNHAELKDSVQVKNELEKKCACEMQPVRVKELKGKIQCRCQSRSANKKSVEEHPRHYFLQVEETTEEESSESGDNRNSLEVITIKVPIRKVSKASRNSNPSPQRNSRKPIPKKERGDVTAGESRYLDQNSEVLDCLCCEDCIGHLHKYVVERSRTSDEICCAHRAQHGDNKMPQRIQEPSRCKCCEDCPGRENLKVEEKKHFDYAMCDNYERQKFNSISYPKSKKDELEENHCDCENCTGQNSCQSLKYPANEYSYQEEGTTLSGECQCCNDCPGRIVEEVKSSQMSKSKVFSACPDTYEEEKSERPSEVPVLLSKLEEKRKTSKPGEENSYKSHNRKCTSDKHNKESCKNVKSRKSSLPRSCQSQRGSKSKSGKLSSDKDKDIDYYNFNRREYLTKSELEREEKKKKPTRLTLQECLTVKRPDLYTRAECRRKIISEKSKDRAEKRNKRIECLSKCLPQCDNPGIDADLKLFTSAQMRKQTKKFYRKLPEVTNKIAEEKKKMQLQTNKLMAEIFAKKLQLHTLKGCLNLSNSFSVLSTM